MDRKGIDISVISPAPPIIYYWADADLAVKAARLVNDGIADMVAAKPSRLRGMATIPLQHPDADHAGDLMYSGALDELADLRICLAHGGGFTPYQIGRLVHGHKVRSEARRFSQSSPKDLLRRLYFDSLVFEPQALRYLIDLVGTDHVCIGTDAPFDMADEHPVEALSAVPRLTRHEHDAVCCGTALRLLGEA